MHIRKTVHVHVSERNDAVEPTVCVALRHMVTCLSGILDRLVGYFLLQTLHESLRIGPLT